MNMIVHSPKPLIHFGETPRLTTPDAKSLTPESPALSDDKGCQPAHDQLKFHSHHLLSIVIKRVCLTPACGSAITNHRQPRRQDMRVTLVYREPQD